MIACAYNYVEEETLHSELAYEYNYVEEETLHSEFSLKGLDRPRLFEKKIKVNQREMG
jgi:hypothetical protein